MPLIERVTNFIKPPYPRVIALGQTVRNGLAYPAEVARDFGWLVCKGPFNINGLRLLMNSEGGRHMYTKHKVIGLGLLKEYGKTNEIAVYDNIREICGKPLSSDNPRTVIFGVLGPDWPGFSASTARVLNGKRLNISFATSLSLKDGTLGFSVFETQIRHEKTLNYLRMIQATIRRDLEIAATRDDWIMGRQEKDAEKDRLFLRCKYILAENKLDGLLNELQTLFSNRSDAYLLARDPEDLMGQIRINSSILEHVRKHPNEIGVGSQSLFLGGKRSVTELTIAANASLLAIEHVFDVLGSSFPHLKIIDSFSFSLPEGISLHQIEFTKNDGASLIEEERVSFEKEFKTLVAEYHVTIPPGTEIEVKLSQALLADCEKSQRPQVIIQPMEITDRRYQSYKVILVAPPDIAEKVHQQFMEAETVLLAAKNVQHTYGTGKKTLQVNIFTVNVEQRSGLKPDEAYAIITGLIEQVTPKKTPVRVFDNTMRTMDTERLEKVLSALKGEIDERFIQDVYLTMPSPNRYLVAQEQTRAHISLAYELLKLKRPAVKISENKEYPLLGVTFPTKGKSILLAIDKIMSELNIPSAITRINTPDDFSIVIYSFKKINELQFKKMKRMIEKVITPQK